MLKRKVSIDDTALITDRLTMIVLVRDDQLNSDEI